MKAAPKGTTAAAWFAAQSFNGRTTHEERLRIIDQHLVALKAASASEPVASNGNDQERAS